MASGLYNSFKSGLMKKVFNLDATDVINIALMNNSYPAAFSAGTGTVWSDISTYEISASAPTVGYSTGGQAIVCSVDGTTSTAKFKTTGTDGLGNATWSTATITAYGAVLYDVTASNRLIAWIDFGGAQSSSLGNFTVSWAGGASEVIVSIT